MENRRTTVEKIQNKLEGLRENIFGGRRKN
jgi:hypothetical protein